MAKSKKIKSEALTVGIQDRADASVQIKRMGDLQREIERIQADHNDNVAELQKQADERVAPLVAEINAIHAGVQAWLALLESKPDLARFIRVKKEVNKDAVLNEPEFFADNPVPGIKIVQGKEFFSVEPHNQELS